MFLNKINQIFTISTIDTTTLSLIFPHKMFILLNQIAFKLRSLHFRSQQCLLTRNLISGFLVFMVLSVLKSWHHFMFGRSNQFISTWITIHDFFFQEINWQTVADLMPAFWCLLHLTCLRVLQLYRTAFHWHHCYDNTRPNIMPNIQTLQKVRYFQVCLPWRDWISISLPW